MPDAKRNNSFSSKFESNTFTSCNSCEPFVSVPVLSKIIVVINRAFSKAVRLRISNPFWAEIEVDMATTKGTAKPKA